MANPNLSVVKSANLDYCTIGEIITYTVVVANNGDTDAQSVLVTDLIPQGSDFINNSVTINSVIATDKNPVFGISLDTIPISTVSTISYSAVIVTLPAAEILENIAQVDYQFVDQGTTPSLVADIIDSNVVISTINTPLIGFTKSFSTTTIPVMVGEEITYEISLSNSGNVTANDIIVLNTLPIGTTFIENSLYVGGTNYPGINLKAPAGIELGNLPKNMMTTISYKVLVESIPSNSIISHFSEIAFNYIVNPNTNRIVNGRFNSNVVGIAAIDEGGPQVGTVDLTGVNKSVNKVFARSGETLTYTIVIPNTGTLDASNVILIDTLPIGTSYVQNSLTIDGRSSNNLLNAINIGTIAAGAVSTVQFSVEIN